MKARILFSMVSGSAPMPKLIGLFRDAAGSAGAHRMKKKALASKLRRWAAEPLGGRGMLRRQISKRPTARSVPTQW